MRQLQLFVALAEEMQFTKAAKRMNIVQSGLSTSIKDLEVEIGARLFERSTRKVILTEAGTILLQHVRAGLSSIEKAVHAIQSLNGIVRGRLNVGVLSCMQPPMGFPSLLRHFHEAFPEVELLVEIVLNATVPVLVSSGKLDISFYGSVDRRQFPGLRVAQFAENSLVAICSKSHRLASQNSVQIEALAGESFIDTTPEKDLRKLIDSIFTQHGLGRTIVSTVNDLGMVVQLVDEGLGVAIVPSSFAISWPGKNLIHRLQITSQLGLPKVQFALLSRSDLKEDQAKKKMVDHFFEILLKYARQPDVANEQVGHS
jgi:DNA-binding transcriptional LysR family regulator